jgi:hypothetical protein
MGFFSFLKYAFVIFAAHLAISCGAPFENHCSSEKQATLDFFEIPSVPRKYIRI